MNIPAQSEEVSWMADLYHLAKRFPDPVIWMSLLEPLEPNHSGELRPFHYWLWMEIWKASHNQHEKDEASFAGKA
jgi:hypothetical protein